MTIHEQLKQVMKPEQFGSWQSDLYVEKTPESDAILKNYQFPMSLSTFKCQTTGRKMYCINFANDDFWARKRA